MISPKMLEAINAQIQAETYSSYLYLGMSAYMESKNLKGFAHWLRLQADEERSHAMRFYDYILDIGEKVTLLAIDKPPVEYGEPKALMTAVLEHEKKITGMIHKLYDMALADKDYRSQIMLQWFVNEQIEEEQNAQEILDKIEMVGEKSTAIWWIDKELKKRGS